MTTSSKPKLPQRISTYQEFWPFYLGEHSHSGNRRLHLLGVALAWIFLTSGLLTEHRWLCLLAPMSGYGLAWYGHFFLQGNRPATFTYPVWSLLSDLRMFFLFCMGRLQKELDRFNIRDR